MESNLKINDLKELYKIFNQLFDGVVKPIIEKKFPRTIYTEPIYYILDNFTLRRFRSGIPLIIADILKVNFQYILPIAAASELMFTIAIVQDDFFDKSEIRGSIQSSHIKYTQEIAMASCNYSYIYVAKILKDLEKSDLNIHIINEIYSLFLDIQEKAFQSVLIELINTRSLNFNTMDILHLYETKTIHGINTIYSAGLIYDYLKGTNIAKSLRNYSLDLAIAGQIKNDVYDITKYSNTRGLTDILNGYLTYPLVKLLERSNESERKKLDELFKSRKAKEIVSIIEKEKIIEICISDSEKYAERGYSHVKGKFPEDILNVLKIWADGNKINRDQVHLSP
jgi:geranylgeranyl pyrophosphate synthase